MNKKKSPTPFTRWVGGKREIVEDIIGMMPDFNGSAFALVSPFTGGGAVEIAILDRFNNCDRAWLNDLNHFLVKIYELIKTDPEELINSTRILDTIYSKISDQNQAKQYYLSIRDKFNKREVSEATRIGYAYFLMQTCFNGIWRENRSGGFNTSHGWRHPNQRILDKENIYRLHTLLSSRFKKYDRVLLRSKNAIDQETIPMVQVAIAFSKFMPVFLFCDPPYYSAGGNFTQYQSAGFGPKEHKILARQLNYLTQCNPLQDQPNWHQIKWMVSNSNVAEVRQLYDAPGTMIHETSVSRRVNCDASKRGKVKELLICNYK